MKRTTSFLLAAAMLSMLAGGCYRTKVQAAGTGASGPTHQERQWFTIAGLVSLSDAAGAECGPSGIARSESLMSGTDILINVGLTVLGGLAGSAACDPDAEPAAYASCVNSLALLVPFLFSTRTVEYSCVMTEPTGTAPGVGGMTIPTKFTATADAPAAAEED